MHNVRKLMTDWAADARGAAAVELALVTLLLLLPILNLVDFGVYAYSRMQVENAAQMGAQWGWSACNINTPNQQPALGATCSSKFEPAVSNGITNTTLGSRVSLVANYPTEGYYCATANGLVLVGTAGKTTGGSGTAPVKPSPFTCDAVAGHSAPAGTAPGDYIQVAVTYTYSPLFSGISLASVLTPTITKTVWSRIA